MLKKFVSLSLIYAILLVSCFSTKVSSQTQSDPVKTDDAAKTDTLKSEPVSPKTDVKKVFSKDLQPLRSDTSVTEIDFNKLEK